MLGRTFLRRRARPNGYDALAAVLAAVLSLLALGSSTARARHVHGDTLKVVLDSLESDTSSTVSIRLGSRQEIAYCDARGRIVLRSGDVAFFSCGGDTMKLNDHTVKVEPFPSPNICDLGLMKYLFGHAPRIQVLLAGSGRDTADTATWRLAVEEYCTEFHHTAFGAPSPLLGTPLADQRAQGGALLNMWNDLYLGNCYAVRPQGQLRCDLAGVPISGQPYDRFCCRDEKILSHYLAKVVKSGRAFRAELGPALLIWGDKW